MAAIRERTLVIVACVICGLLLYASWRGYVETGLKEAFGFVTGAACVWLGVKQNVWTWPVGIANNALYLIVFVESRLFADAGLQIAFAALAAYGWYAWMQHAGTRALTVVRTPRATWVALGVAVTLATALMSVYLTRVADAAPFLDAATTTLSLAAQFMMTRKYVECWWVWILVDVISIGLYAFKHLELTAVLAAIYMAMCVVGLRSWSITLGPREAAPAHA